MTSKTSKDNINNIPEDAGNPPVTGAIWINEYVKQNGVRVHGHWRGPDGTHYEPYQFKFNDGSDTSIATPRLSKKSQASPTAPAPTSVTVTTLSPKASASLTADSIADSTMSYIDRESITDSFNTAENIDEALLKTSIRNDIMYHAPQIVRDSILNGDGLPRWEKYDSYEDMAEDIVRHQVYNKLGLDYRGWDTDNGHYVGGEDSSVDQLSDDMGTDDLEAHGQVKNVGEYASEALQTVQELSQEDYKDGVADYGTVDAIDAYLPGFNVVWNEDDARRFVASAVDQGNEDASFDDLTKYNRFTDAAHHILRSQMLRKANLNPDEYALRITQIAPKDYTITPTSKKNSDNNE